MVPPDAGAPTDLEIQTAIGTLRRAGHRRVQSLGYHVQWHDYAMPHSVCMEEVADLQRWLVQVLGDR